MSDTTAAAIEAVACAINRLADAVLATKGSLVPQADQVAVPAPAPKKRKDSLVTLSESLASMTGLPVDEPVTRQAAASKVMDYVRENDLQDTQDRRKIVPDAALAELVGSDAVLNVLNLKSALKDHFTPC